MRDIREGPGSDQSDQDVSLDSGIFIPRRLSPGLRGQDRGKRAALSAVDETHWRKLNQQHLNSGIPAQTISMVCNYKLPL